MKLLRPITRRRPLGGNPQAPTEERIAVGPNAAAVGSDSRVEPNPSVFKAPVYRKSTPDPMRQRMVRLNETNPM